LKSFADKTRIKMWDQALLLILLIIVVSII